jgi:hypothetical protein
MMSGGRLERYCPMVKKQDLELFRLNSDGNENRFVPILGKTKIVSFTVEDQRYD